MTVLVTGALGLLGSHVVDLLVEGGERARALVHPDDAATGGLLPREVEVYRGDVRDPRALEAALGGVERVLHCAARTGPWGPEREFHSTNVRALEALVDLAAAAGVRRVVHVSSITVHGNDIHGTGDETTPTRAEPNPYSRSKLAGERLLERMVAGGAPVTIVRPGWIYGPRDAASFGRIAARIRAGRMVMIGPGHNHLPLIYARDAARGVLLASEAPRAVGRSYVLVNDEPVTQHAYLSAIAAELGAPGPRHRVPYGVGLMMGRAAEAGARLARLRQPPPLTRYGVQLLGGENRFVISRARGELGFSPDVTLAEGVRHAVEWYRATNGSRGG